MFNHVNTDEVTKMSYKFLKLHYNEWGPKWRKLISTRLIKKIQISKSNATFRINAPPHKNETQFTHPFSHQITRVQPLYDNSGVGLKLANRARFIVF